MTFVYTLIAVLTAGLNINCAAYDASTSIASRGAVPYSSIKEINSLTQSTLSNMSLLSHEANDEGESQAYKRSDLSTLSESDRHARSDRLVVPFLLNNVQCKELGYNSNVRDDASSPSIPRILKSFLNLPSSTLIPYEVLCERGGEQKKESDILNQELESSYEELEDFYTGEHAVNSNDRDDASSPLIPRILRSFPERLSSTLIPYEALDEEHVNFEKEDDALNQTLGSYCTGASNTVRISSLPSFGIYNRSFAVGRAGGFSRSQSIANFDDVLSLKGNGSKIEVSGCLLGVSFDGVMQYNNSHDSNRLGAGDLIETSESDTDSEGESPLMLNPSISFKLFPSARAELITVTFANSNRKETVTRSSGQTMMGQQSLTPLNSIDRAVCLPGSRSEKSRLNEASLNYLTPIRFATHPISNIEMVRLKFISKNN